MTCDAVDYHWIYRETLNRFEIHAQRVREGKGLEAAIEFAQFIMWSGLPQLMQKHAAEGPLKVDGAHLRWRAEELEALVRSQWKREPVPVIDLTELERINNKLEVIAAYVHKALGVAPGIAPEEPAEGKIIPLERVAT